MSTQKHQNTANYIGRFAPSPTGDLHFGSLLSAVASFLDAKAHNGLWLIRMEDIDTPRMVPGADRRILESLATHGMFPDREVIYQSLRSDRYTGILERLLANDACFYCNCSRTLLRGWLGYPGTCRNKQLLKPPFAIRLKAGKNDVLSFNDRLQGTQYPPGIEKRAFHDFVIKRRDGFYAYQLACVVDDIDSGVTHIVRGYDILDSTFKQNCLYKYLDLPSPTYLHLPVLINPEGQKLSKQNLAPALNNRRPVKNLLNILALLQQPLPDVTPSLTVHDLLSFATTHWEPARLPAKPSLLFEG